MKKSKIGYIEWVLVFGLFIVIDIAQWGIDFIVPPVGEIINAVLDVFIAVIFAFYLYMRGVIGFGEIITQIVGFLFKEGTASIDPWTIEVLVIFLLTEGTELFQKVTTIAGSVAGGSKITGKVASFVGPEGNMVGKAMNNVSTRADKVKQAADAAGRNSQIKIQGQQGGQFKSPYRTQTQTDQNDASDRITAASPRAAQLAVAQQAVDRKKERERSNIIALNFNRSSSDVDLQQAT